MYVDDSEEWGYLERAESEERWFEDEEPSWVGEPDEEEADAAVDVDAGVDGNGQWNKMRRETGVQDF